jgi:DNA-binding NarL/FixJ family response regulator
MARVYLGRQVLRPRSNSDQEQVLDAVDAGAVGYLLKDADPTGLVDGVRAAAAGQSPLDPQVARTLLTRRTTQAPHLTSVFQRIGVTDRTLWAERNGLRRPRG